MLAPGIYTQIAVNIPQATILKIVGSFVLFSIASCKRKYIGRPSKRNAKNNTIKSITPAPVYFTAFQAPSPARLSRVLITVLNTLFMLVSSQSHVDLLPLFDTLEYQQQLLLLFLDHSRNSLQ